ncbi:hypothetical protein R1Q26_25135 (plasmid) [Klebsiella quasipneumoniae]|uniref:hypothetical protein n=1 Tax=Klebsiella quasipneumoniae TaxID=1463165 RepID=UPI00292BC07A|nr:hypothetical protein [Klebsiella quasipneumoniae]WPA30788.1 hypothetical protein R1Q26_25135 [Klebsiella quasipneumoniae]HBR2254474.1 hypothetical protein [Klebsiella pneumoniae]
MEKSNIQLKIKTFTSNIEYWFGSENDSEAKQKNKSFWEGLKKEFDDNDSWVERVKSESDDAKKLVLALKFIPLPQAFQQSAIALRSLIKLKKKENTPYVDELYFLYWLAAIKSFGVPYSQLLGEPGFNVLSRIPGGEILNLQVNYDDLGHEYLDLLTKGDVSLLNENFGVPKNNNTLNNIHCAIWHHYEKKLKSEKDKDLSDFFASL